MAVWYRILAFCLIAIDCLENVIRFIILLNVINMCYVWLEGIFTEVDDFCVVMA